MEKETKTYLTGIDIDYVNDMGFFKGIDYHGRLFSGFCYKKNIKDNKIEVRVVSDVFKFGEVGKKPNYCVVIPVNSLSFQVNNGKSVCQDRISVKPENLEEITE
ncbi:hypothetical protein GOV12_05020 [Candidatus Pacearchaeota archaeon]|nr:hypothetical protein [Candidatus Pacearchaeota archaeon]